MNCKLNSIIKDKTFAEKNLSKMSLSMNQHMQDNSDSISLISEFFLKAAEVSGHAAEESGQAAEVSGQTQKSGKVETPPACLELSASELLL